MTLIAECINRAHKATEHVVIVLENMVCRALPLYGLSWSFDSDVGRLRQYHWVPFLGAREYHPTGRRQDSGRCMLGHLCANPYLHRPSLHRLTYDLAFATGHMFAAVSCFEQCRLDIADTTQGYDITTKDGWE